MNSPSKPDNPLISVITVCYNAFEFIEECLKSVIIQECNNFEYIVIDGGSNDGTTMVIKKYEDYIAYWHSKPDRGLSHAFNIGVEKSSGRWLLFLNSDDTFANAKVLGRIQPHLETNKEKDVVLGQVLMVSRDAIRMPLGGPYGAAFNWNAFRFRVTIPHQAAFINRIYFDRYGLFREDYACVMDYEHLLRAGKMLKVAFRPIVIAHMKDGGLTKTNIFRSHKAICRAQVENGALKPYEGRLNNFYLDLRYLLSRTLIGEYWRKRRAKKIQRGLLAQP